MCVDGKNLELTRLGIMNLSIHTTCMPSCPIVNCLLFSVTSASHIPYLNASSSETHPCVSIDLFKLVSFTSLPFSGIIVQSSPFLPSQQINCLCIGIHLGLISAPVKLVNQVI